MSEEFYLVWNPDSPKSPQVQHPSEELARIEAERLARQHPGQKFYVLRPEAFCVKKDVRWSDEGDSDIPF